MSTGIELDKLLSLALGAPEVGAVNFNILHGVLSEIIKTIGVEKKLVEIKDNGDFKAPFGSLNKLNTPPNDAGEDAKVPEGKTLYYSGDKTPLPATNIFPNGELFDKVSKLENRLNVLDELPDNYEILKRAKEKKEAATPIKDIWQFININRRLSATETAIDKLSSLLEQAISEISTVQDVKNDLAKMKESISNMEEQNKKMTERLKTLENSDESLQKLKQTQIDLDRLQAQVDTLPTKWDVRDIDICMKWPQFEAALKDGSLSTFENPRKLGCSDGNKPSNEVLDTIKQIGDIVNKQGEVVREVQELKETMPTKANQKDLEELANRPAAPDDIMAQLDSFKTHMKNMLNWKDDILNKKIKNYRVLHPTDGFHKQTQGIDNLEQMSKSMKEFQDNLRNYNISLKNLVAEGREKQNQIDRLNSNVENLQENKADKDTVSAELDGKADKLLLDNMVSRMKFDSTFGALDQSIQDILSQLSAQESALQDAISKLNGEVDHKMDRTEIDPLKDYINKRIKANKCKHVDVPITDDSAAGMTKPSTKYHCISCARPVEAQAGMSAIPLPVYPGFPPSKSSRPYQPYEMENMRQQARSYYEGNQEHIPNRPCGGAHTMTYTARKVSPTKANYYIKEEEAVIIPLRNESPVHGHDGQVYKGTKNDYNEQLPTLQQNQQVSPNNTPRPPVVVTNPQTSPRTYYTRPRSAVIK